MNRINLICLGVKDIEKSLEFYRNIGFQTKETAKRPAIVFFNNKGTKLELYPLAELAKDINPENPPATAQTEFNGITLAYNALSAQEVDSLLAKAQKNGAKIVKAPQETAWGGYGGYFRDLDGYYWEVAYGPMFRFDENEMLVL